MLPGSGSHGSGLLPGVWLAAQRAREGEHGHPHGVCDYDFLKLGLYENVAAHPPAPSALWPGRMPRWELQGWGQRVPPRTSPLESPKGRSVRRVRTEEAYPLRWITPAIPTLALAKQPPLGQIHSGPHVPGQAVQPGHGSACLEAGGSFSPFSPCVWRGTLAVLGVGWQEGSQKWDQGEGQH